MKDIPVGAIVRFIVNPPEDPKKCKIWQWKSGLVVSYKSSDTLVVMTTDGFHECEIEWVDEVTPQNDWLPGSKKE